MFKGKKTSLRSLEVMLELGWVLVLVTGSSGGAAREEGQVGAEEFWFSGNSCRALKSGSRMRRMPGLTWLHHCWVSLDLHHRSVFCYSEMCEFSPRFVGKSVLPSRVFWRHLWQMTVFSKHTDPGQFIWGGAEKVLPAEHSAVNIIRPWLKDNWSNLDFYCEFCEPLCCSRND